MTVARAAHGLHTTRTAKGWVGFCFDEDGGLLRVTLPMRARAEVRRRIGGTWGASPEADLPASLSGVADALAAYLAGAPIDPAAIEVPLVFDGETRFRAAVYHALRKVPRGRVVTYGDLASAAGSPGAARGVGTAMAKNRYPILVPCHRVVGSGGALGGFSAPGGSDTKRMLLDLEGWGSATRYA